jgi:RimJ/RimL family protein N-acetyltransferase
VIVSLVVTRDVDEFARRAEPLLAQRIDCNVMATLVIGLLDGHLGEVEPLFAVAHAQGGEPLGAALRIPPWPLLVSSLAVELVPELLERWLELDDGLPGVNGPPASAQAVAREWCRVTGGSSALRRLEAMHELMRVLDPPHPTEGGLRPAERAEHDLLVGWMTDFVREARVSDAAQAEQMVSSGLSRGGLYVWEDREPVSLLGMQSRVSGVVRIGPVYTPPEFRRRGYATAAVASASHQALDSGAERCMLFTDLANPTSNKIYAAIGYQRIGDWEEHVFSPPSSP